jgi:hypothetical protein
LSALEAIGEGYLARKRFDFWNAESRKRPLQEWESGELERAMREVERSDRRDMVRAQAAPPPARKRRARG